MEAVKEIGMYKKAHKLPIRDEKVEKEVIERAKQICQEIEIPADLGKRILEIIIEYSLKLQQHLMKDYDADMQSFSIAIVGGTGGMGRLLSSELKKIGIDVMICSRSKEKAQKIAREISAKAGTIEEASSADIVIVSVPIEDTLEVCLSVGKKMKPSSLLMEISSVKTNVVDELIYQLPDEVEFISLHPLFGPEGSFEGENVIVIPARTKIWLPKIKQILKELGSNYAITTVEEHERIMSVMQVLHHFSYFCLASALASYKEELESDFYTRSFKKTKEFFVNLQKNLEVLLAIQRTNPRGEEIRNNYANLVERLVNANFQELESTVTKSFEILLNQEK